MHTPLLINASLWFGVWRYGLSQICQLLTWAVSNPGCIVYIYILSMILSINHSGWHSNRYAVIIRKHKIIAEWLFANQSDATVCCCNTCNLIPNFFLPLRWYATNTNALEVDERKGNLGFTVPTADNALVMAVATVCSRYPSIGRAVTATGCFNGGSLFGSKSIS